MTFAVVFSGQGMQSASMLRWLPEDVLSTHWRNTEAHSPALFSNAVAQPLLVRVGLQAWNLLKPQCPEPLAYAGYSVGELSAFVAAGALSQADALRLVPQRAACMDAAGEQHPGGLLAISHYSDAVLAELQTRYAVELSIRTGVDTALLGAPRSQLAALADVLQSRGMTARPLAVSVASHTTLMEPARQAFERVLSTVAFQAPNTVLFCNADGTTVRTPERARWALAHQLSHTVQWLDCMQGLYERGVRCLLEIGPCKGLSTMWQQNFEGVHARSVDEFSQQSAIIDWVHRHAE
ncbi:acyltransferase domain-containing protein [Limnobacter humi]|uniref:Acyltransferase domain-containing protein n=1 Tax=Limnobacter humi TaxID=1778671 RepID=A0ABT1WCH7_9BURK|nr:acyltransferase domain-containing protein [Limnobacter humi]MCQ8895205.1 acyltransferase domain-containing protein [Limnobacter humi]